MTTRGYRFSAVAFAFAFVLAILASTFNVLNTLENSFLLNIIIVIAIFAIGWFFGSFSLKKNPWTIAFAILIIGVTGVGQLWLCSSSAGTCNTQFLVLTSPFTLNIKKHFFSNFTFLILTILFLESLLGRMKFKAGGYACVFLPMIVATYITSYLSALGLLSLIGLQSMPVAGTSIIEVCALLEAGLALLYIDRNEFRSKRKLSFYDETALFIPPFLILIWMFYSMLILPTMGMSNLLHAIGLLIFIVIDFLTFEIAVRRFNLSLV